MVYWIYIMMHSVYIVFIALQEQCIDMNSCEFSVRASHLICLTARYVANATRIHIISSFCRGWWPHQPEKTYRIYKVNISSKRSLHIDRFLSLAWHELIRNVEYWRNKKRVINGEVILWVQKLKYWEWHCHVFY